MILAVLIVLLAIFALGGAFVHPLLFIGILLVLAVAFEGRHTHRW